MNEKYGPFHRLGEPGGPGCEAVAIPIGMKTQAGEVVQGHLIDAQGDATELELLRTVAKQFGVKWGHDDFGWWAALPTEVRCDDGDQDAGLE